MNSRGKGAVLIEYPDTRIAILASFMSNFRLVGCNTNVTEGVSHFCTNESRTINLFSKYIAIVFKLRYTPDAYNISHLAISRNCRYIAVLKSLVLFSIQQSTSDLSLVLMSRRTVHCYYSEISKGLQILRYCSST